MQICGAFEKDQIKKKGIASKAKGEHSKKVLLTVFLIALDQTSRTLTLVRLEKFILFKTLLFERFYEKR